MFRFITGLGKPSPPLKELLREGWHEIPEIIVCGVLMVAGYGMMALAVRNYQRENLYHARFRKYYVVYRPDDPNVQYIRTDNGIAKKP